MIRSCGDGGDGGNRNRSYGVETKEREDCRATTAGLMISARLRKRPRDIRESAFSLAASSRSICLCVRKIVENPPVGGGDE